MDDLDELYRRQDRESVTNRYHQRRQRRSQKWQDFYAGRTVESPFDDSEEEEYHQTLKDWTAYMPRFFEDPASRKLPIFWHYGEENTYSHLGGNLHGS
ncbi:hypothetical protein NW762_012697 [Fusarium torreyae]|uniref:Uncharacterized protein n=1 Tax=Fusarium torreyae TaxID=1237075 RepID=A0A9W8VB26_9HYPO|nr:hypothetical protein NW762_012697 [Fusarium torreyae]